jgi:hypothetical protein
MTAVPVSGHVAGEIDDGFPIWGKVHERLPIMFSLSNSFEIIAPGEPLRKRAGDHLM